MLHLSGSRDAVYRPSDRQVWCARSIAKISAAVCSAFQVEVLESRLLLSVSHAVHPAAKPHVPVAVVVKTHHPDRPLLGHHPARPDHHKPHRPPRVIHHDPLGSYGYGVDPGDDGIFPPEDGDGEDGGDGDLLAYAGPTELPTGITNPIRPQLTVVPGTWTAAGPAPIVNGQDPGSAPVSGRIVAIAASASNASIIYLAAAGGGVWKTTNAGVLWVPLTDNQATTVMGSIAIAPSDPNTIYAGTGEANNSIDSYYGRGILKSTDAGATWTMVGTSVFFRHAVSKIVIDSANPSIVYALVGNGGSNGFGGSTGVWKSTDGGTTWANTTTSIDSSTAYSDLTIDPTNSQVLYCAIGSFGGATNNGVYKSINGGGTWTKLATFPAMGSTAGRIALSIATTNSQIIYASASDPSTSGVLGVYKSIDGGTSWTTITPTSNYMAGQGWYDQTIAVSPTDANTVYVGGSSSSTSAVMKTSNGGTSWTGIATGQAGNNGPHADHHAAAFDASGRFLDGNDGGIWRLDNSTVGAIAWTDLTSNIAATQYIGVAIGPTDSTNAFGGAQDNGTSQQNTASNSWTLREGGDGGTVLISPNDTNRVYHIAPVGSFGASSYFRRSDSNGTSWTSKTTGLGSGDSTNFYPPFALDPNSYGGNDRLLLGTTRVYETNNNADTWSPLSTPNTAGWNVSSSIDTLAVALSDINTIYASANGATFVTTNRGVSWTRIDITGSSGHVQQIVVDPTNSQIAYAVRDRFGGGKIFQTQNGGATWINITGNIPDDPAYSLVIKPNGPGTADDVLYVGTDTGVYTSSNLGTSWSILGTGLPTTQVHSLQLNRQNVLAAGTYGRGLWKISIGTPVDNVAATQDGNEAHVIWAANNDGTGTGFAVQRSVDGGAFAPLVSVGIGQTTYVDTTTSPTHSYQYQVQMVMGAGASTFAPSNAITIQPTGDVDQVGGFNAATSLTLNGAKLTGGRLQLTDGGLSEGKSAFLTLGSGPLANFYTEFNFQFTNPSADGFTFTLQSGAPNLVGRAGGDLGYGGIAKSLAVFFNFYSGGAAVSQTGLFTGGLTTGAATNILSNAFHTTDVNGKTHIFHVTLGYTSSTKKLAETVLDTTTLSSFSTTYTVDAPATLGDACAYAGFTAGSGSLSATQEIANWWWSPTGNLPPFQLNGTIGADTIYLKADADHLNIDYWLNTPTDQLFTGKFSNTFSGVDIHGLGSADIITLDESGGEVLLGVSLIDDFGTNGAATLNIIGSTGNDILVMDPAGAKLAYANNGAAIAAGKSLAFSNIVGIGFTGNGGNDAITTAGPPPFTLILSATGSENLTVLSGTVVGILTNGNDAMTIDNIGGIVNLIV